MGRVYRAFDPNIGRNLAVKVIPLDTADPELAMRFRREAQAAGILSHPNIVTIFDAGEDGGFLYIAMELVDGQTLQQMLSKGPLPVEQAISFCEQTCAALDHAHARAIIHRDIKPANIMVQAGVVKVTDFGVAKSGAAGMTSTGQVLGTPQYLAPEVVKGGGASARSDIFSLGVVLYEMLTGRRAFAGDNLSTIIYRIIAEQPPAPSLVISTLPPGVNYAVMKALAKEPDERYTSCAQLIADLKNHPALEQQGRALLQAATDSPPFPDMLSKTARMDLGINLESTQPHLAPAAVPSTAASGASRKKLGYGVGAIAAGLLIGAVVWFSRPSGNPPAASPAAETTLAPAATTAAPGMAPDPAPVPPNDPAPSAAPPSSPAASAPGATRAATPPATRPAPPAPALAPVAAMGRLVIHTEPAGARILLDGQATAYRTPVNLAVAAGQHQITIELEGFQPVTREATVEPNRAAQVRLELEKSGGGGILRRIPFVR
jgi:serine/threonine-protein kinase